MEAERDRGVHVKSNQAKSRLKKPTKCQSQLCYHWTEPKPENSRVKTLPELPQHKPSLRYQYSIRGPGINGRASLRGSASNHTFV